MTPLTPLLLTAVLAVSLASPAAAEVLTFTGSDTRLYLNERMSDPAQYRLLSSWSASGADQATQLQPPSALVRGVSSLGGDVFVSRGPFRISNERFFELLSKSGVAPEFVAKYGQGGRNPNVWVPALSAVIIGAGAGTAYAGNTSYNWGLATVGYTVIGLGGLGLLYSVYDFFLTPKLPSKFPADEAYEAIQAYNKQLGTTTP